jgi:hypothetical protein
MLIAGCSLNWAARSDEPDAGTDAGKESGPDAVPPPPPGDDGPTPDSPSVDCKALANDIASKRQAAKACVQPGTAFDCKTVRTDECHCKLTVLAEAGSANTAFDDAVATFLASPCDAGCEASCGINPDTLSQTAWGCAPINSQCYP